MNEKGYEKQGQVLNGKNNTGQSQKIDREKSRKSVKGVFITGTGTDMGKTYVAGLILKKLHQNGISSAYSKAAMSGNERRDDGSLIPGDAVMVKEMSGIPQPLEEMCPYIYENAVSPHLASQMEGNPVAMEQVKRGFETVCAGYSYVTMEGSGGILCPICCEGNELWLEDIIKACGLGCVVVADAGLGTINHVGLTVFYMKQKMIPVRGIIFNHYEPGNVLHEDNRKMCESLTGVKVVACVRDGDEELDIPIESLKELYEEEKA